LRSQILIDPRLEPTMIWSYVEENVNAVSADTLLSCELSVANGF
jgi:hypothetical protein